MHITDMRSDQPRLMVADVNHKMPIWSFDAGQIPEVRLLLKRKRHIVVALHLVMCRQDDNTRAKTVLKPAPVIRKEARIH